jgi:signal transduction histidine kinase
MPASPPAAAQGRDAGHWVGLFAVATWLACSVPPLASVVAGRFGSSRQALLFLMAFAIYGGALCVSLWPSRWPGLGSRTGRRIALLAAQSVAGAIMVALSRNGTTAATLVIVAAELPYVLNRPAYVCLWIAAQTLTIGVIFFAEAWRTVNGVMTAVTFGGFQVFAAASSFLARRERMARESLARANAELHETRALLVEKSLTDERLRISRDLHDTLGHHLTALTLQLDLASRVTDDKRTEPIRQAHAIARLLLAEVRDVVGRLREEREIDLARAVRALASGQTALAIHVDAPSSLVVDDASMAAALVHAIQEIITNTIRHAEAHNLWVQIETTPDAISLLAKDDGRGARDLRLGNGLTGMRERFEARGGHVAFTSPADGGFEVRGTMPMRARA